MVKTIETQTPVRITITKDGRITADFLVQGIKGCLDTDDIKMSMSEDRISGEVILRLGV